MVEGVKSAEESGSTKEGTSQWNAWKAMNKQNAVIVILVF